VGDVPRPRIHPRVGDPVRGSRSGGRHRRRRLRLPDLPHRSIVAYLAQTHRLLNEYCVTFPDQTRPYGSARLPDSDDVLAKWMALTGDETRLIRTANMHLPGRQLDPSRVKRDLWRLSQWERGWMRAVARRGSAEPPQTPLDAAGQ
jgi:hypothetical protein